MQSQSKRGWKQDDVRLWWHKHTEWLPFGTPPQFYEDLRAMNNFKTDQARKNRKIPSIVGGTSFFALLVALMVVALTLISSLYASNLIQAIARMPSFESVNSDKLSSVALLSLHVIKILKSTDRRLFGLPLLTSCSHSECGIDEFVFRCC